MLQLTLIAALFAQTPAQTPQSTEKPKLVVLELTAAGGVDESVAAALTEAMTDELGTRGTFEVIGAREIQTLISVERQRTLLGCKEDGSSCLTELAGALGARFVLSGTLAKLGTSYQLTLQMLDTHKSQILGRATRIAPTLEQLRAGVPWAVAEATGTPAPPRPSNVASFSLALAGGLAIAGGGVIGFTALSDESRIGRELELGQNQQGVLKSVDFYREESQRIAWQKTGSIAAMGVGAALVGLGALLYQRDPSSLGALALVPTGRGAALVGVWP